MLHTENKPQSLISKADASLISTLLQELEQGKVSKYKVINTLRSIKNKGLLGKSLSFKSLFTGYYLTNPSNLILLEDIMRVLYSGRTDINFAKYSFITGDPNDILKNSQDRWKTAEEVDLNNYSTLIALSKETLDDMNNPFKVADRALKVKPFLTPSDEKDELRVLIHNIGLTNTLILFNLLGYVLVKPFKSMDEVTKIN